MNSLLAASQEWENAAHDMEAEEELLPSPHLPQLGGIESTLTGDSLNTSSLWSIILLDHISLTTTMPFE